MIKKRSLEPAETVRPIITAMSATSRHQATGPGVRPDRQNPYLRIHAVNIFVRDQDRSLEFYLHQLGFNLALDRRVQSGHRVVAVAPPDGLAALNLIAPHQDSSAHKLIGRSTQVVFLTEAFDLEEKRF